MLKESEPVTLSGDPFNDTPLGFHPPYYVPVQTSVPSPGLRPSGDESAKILGRELRFGKLGEAVGRIRDNGSHALIEARNSEFVIWAGKHRPQLDKKATILTAVSATTVLSIGTYVAIRKSRRRK